MTKIFLTISMLLVALKCNTREEKPIVDSVDNRIAAFEEVSSNLGDTLFINDTLCSIFFHKKHEVLFNSEACADTVKLNYITDGNNYSVLDFENKYSMDLLNIDKNDVIALYKKGKKPILINTFHSNISIDSYFDNNQFEYVLFDDSCLGDSLAYFASNGDLEKVKEIIADGYDINKTSLADRCYDYDVLYAAICGDQPAVTKYLIEGGANVNRHYGEYQYTPLSLISFMSDKKTAVILAKELIDRGADVNCSYNHISIMNYPVISAISERNVELLELLIELNADILLDDEDIITDYGLGYPIFSEVLSIPDENAAVRIATILLNTKKFTNHKNLMDLSNKSKIQGKYLLSEIFEKYIVES